MAEPIRFQMRVFTVPVALVVILVLSLAGSTGAAEKAKVVFISGSPSHGQMHHEHRAGNMILAQALNRSGLDVEAVLVPHYGYPREKAILQDAATCLALAAVLQEGDQRDDEEAGPQSQHDQAPGGRPDGGELGDGVGGVDVAGDPVECQCTQDNG